MTGIAAGSRFGVFDATFDGITVLEPIRDGAGSVVDFRIVYANRAAFDASGQPVAERVGQRWSKAYPQVVPSGLLAACREVLTTGEPFEARDFRHADDLGGGDRPSRWYELRATRAGEFVIVAHRDTTASRDAGSGRVPLAAGTATSDGDLRVLRAAAALARTVTVDEVLDTIFEHAVRWLGGQSIGVWLVDDHQDVLRFGGGSGMTPGSAESVGDIPLDSELPAASVVRTGDPVVYHSLEERGRRWPSLAAIPSESEAAVVLKLDARGKRLGCLSISFAGAGSIGTRLTTLEAVAEQCALALDRALLLEAERRARETLEFLAAGTALMVSALEPDIVVHRLVALAVPRLADSCAVYLSSGDRLVRTASAAVHDAHPESAAPPEQVGVEEDTPVAAAFRTGLPQEFRDPPADRRTVAAGRPVRRAAAVALHAAGQTVGVMVVWFAADRAQTDVDQFALTGLAARAAIALTNARKYHRQLEAADMLAAAVLPAELPTPATVEFAARYIPAGAAVAGDWYDAFTRPDGVVVFGVGDASGHGLPAVSVMTGLRNAARALGVTGMSPSVMLSHMSVLAAMSGPEDSFATALYGTLDPTTGQGSWCSAGHLPALLLRPDGTSEFLALGAAPLGVDHPSGYTDRPLDLSAGSALVIVSDGVIERRGASLDAGMAALRRAVSSAPDLRAEPLAGHLAAVLCQAPQDDCCILVIRRLG